MPLLGLLRQVEQDGHPAAHPHISSVLTAAEVARAASGLALTCWTVNRPSDLLLSQECGMHAVITDDPVRARAAVLAPLEESVGGRTDRTRLPA